MGGKCRDVWFKDFVWDVSELNGHFDYAKRVIVTYFSGFMVVACDGTSKFASCLRTHVLALWCAVSDAEA